MEITMEAEARDQINEQLEDIVWYEDTGIGAYEWHGSKEVDINLELSLTSSKVLVEYTDDKDEMIYVMIQGYYKDYETDIEMEWVAELDSITPLKGRGYMATYEIRTI